MYLEADFRVLDRDGISRSIYSTAFHYEGNDFGLIEKISYEEFRNRRHDGDFDTSANIYDVAESIFDYYWIETNDYTHLGRDLNDKERIRDHNSDSMVALSEVTEILDMEKLAENTEVRLIDAELVQDA